MAIGVYHFLIFSVEGKKCTYSVIRGGRLAQCARLVHIDFMVYYGVDVVSLNPTSFIDHIHILFNAYI